MATPNAPDVFLTLSNSNSMTPEDVLRRLCHYARVAAEIGSGIVVEIGAYRGASTVALAMGLMEAGRGHVHSIDPHRDFSGILGGVFSPDDHVAYETTLRRHGVEDWVTHHCEQSADCAAGWTGAIDLLLIDGDHSYEGVATDLRLWLPHLANGATLVIDDHTGGSEVEAAVRDHLPFSRYVSVERVGNALVLRKTLTPRTLILCGGMQSSGSTLVSMCFLQRNDMDGVYDLDNPFIQQDFSRVFSETAWVKMTIGSFRLWELAELYSAQGWSVRPLLIHRAPEDILTSLLGKWYGVDGCTGDDPPLLTRLQRYMADVEDARVRNWATLHYSDLVRSPEAELLRVCTDLGLAWDPRMVTWPKPEADFAYPSEGNVSLRKSFVSGAGLVETMDRYRHKQHKPTGSQSPETETHARLAKALVTRARRAITEGRDANVGTLAPCRFKGTRRDHLENEIRQLHEGLGDARSYINRLTKHPVIGLVIRLWVALVNPGLAKPAWNKPSDQP